MSKKFIIIAVVILAAVGLIGWFVSARNGFVFAEESLNEQWAKVEVQYQRRLDLIPNLVETVKGYAAHESETFENVTKARAGLSDAYNRANEQQAQAEQAPGSEAALNSYSAAQADLTRALNIYVNAVHEAYPDLKANAQFADLQAQLEGTENRIATERGRYTESVRNYNVKVRTFPGSIVASCCGFSPKPQFQSDPEAASAPKVSF